MCALTGAIRSKPLWVFLPLKELISRKRLTAACAIRLPFLFPLFSSRPIVLGYNELRSSASDLAAPHADFLVCIL